MKILKYILIGIAVIIVVLLIVSAFMPAKMTATRSIVINASASVVFGEVNDLGRFDKWSPWKVLDPEMEQKVSDNSVGVGAWTSWKGPQSGSGKMTIVESRPNEYIRLSLDFDEEGGELSYSDWNFKDSAGATLTSWGFDGEPMPFYFRLVMAMYKGMIEKQYDNGLRNLKELVEAKPKEATGATYEIHEMDMPERVYIAKRDSLTFDKISEFYLNNLPAIFEAVGKAKLQPAGAPSGLFFKWDEANNSTLMAAAIAVMGDAKTSLKGYETIVVPAGKNLHIAYMGSYEKSGEAHAAMDSYMKEKNLEQINPVIEEYITDPMNEPDTSKWLTNIYYPVK